MLCEWNKHNVLAASRLLHCTTHAAVNRGVRTVDNAGWQYALLRFWELEARQLYLLLNWPDARQEI